MPAARLMAHVVDECRVFSGLRGPFDVKQSAPHSPQCGACGARGAVARPSDADENTLHSSREGGSEEFVTEPGLPRVHPAESVS